MSSSSLHICLHAHSDAWHYKTLQGDKEVLGQAKPFNPLKWNVQKQGVGTVSGILRTHPNLHALKHPHTNLFLGYADAAHRQWKLNFWCCGLMLGGMGIVPSITSSTCMIDRLYKGHGNRTKHHIKHMHVWPPLQGAWDPHQALHQAHAWLTTLTSWDVSHSFVILTWLGVHSQTQLCTQRVWNGLGGGFTMPRPTCSPQLYSKSNPPLHARGFQMGWRADSKCPRPARSPYSHPPPPVIRSCVVVSFVWDDTATIEMGVNECQRWHGH